jgi:glycerol-3-phosphate O-acyltransferase
MAVAQGEPADKRLRRDFGLFARRFAARYFDPVPFPAEAAKELSGLTERGEVVHVMRSAGALCFLYLAWSLLKLELPPLRAVTGLKWSFWSPFRRLFRGGSAAQQLTRALDKGSGALVFLRESSGWIPKLEPKEDPFFALIRRARSAARPLFLVPELFLWRARARNLKPGIREFLFGSPEDPGLLITAWSFLRNFRNAFMRVGAPIELTAFVREHAEDSDAVLVRKVRGSLYQHLARETRALVGPPRKTRERLIEETLRDRTLKAALEGAAAHTRIGLDAARRRAARNLRQIAADYTGVVIAIARPVLTFVFNRVHAGVEIDEPGFERALASAREAPVIYCPSHKSHLDYLLMAWVFAERGLMAPLVAAGANLSFWPLGPFFRGGGAFFLRRSFKGDAIYTATFKAYVKKLMKEGYGQEFFIEGGRSRTGKLLSPKLGMVAFEVEAFLEGAQDDVYFVPVAIDYETILEAKSYARELAGGEKKPESLKSLLSAPKILTAKLGRIYLSFEEPISLRKFLLARGVDPAQVTEEQKRTAIRALAQRIAFGISRAQTITPAALLASALLAHRRRGITAKEAGARIHLLRELARRENARLSPAMESAPSDPSSLGPINDVVRLLLEDGSVEAQVVGGETIYRVPDERRAGLCFYKNNLVHLAIGRSFVAFALLAEGGEASWEALGAHVRFLVRLLKLEFSFPVGLTFENVLAETVAQLAAEGRVVREGGDGVAQRVKVAPEPFARPDLAFLRDLNRDLLESYRIVAAALPLAQEPIDRKQLIKLALERGRADFLAGSTSCAEALSRSNLENAIALYEDEGVLVAAEEGRRVELSAEHRGAPEKLLEPIDRLLAAP